MKTTGTSMLGAALIVGSALAAPSPAPAVVSAAGAASLKETTWNPPASMKAALDAVWKHEMSTYSPKPDPLTFKNYGYQQVIANKGKLHYCVRLDTRKTVDAAARKQIAAALQKGIGQWNNVLRGFDGWPYSDIPVDVVGWAASSKSQLPGLNEATEGKYYSDRDGEGKPQCAEACGRFFHQDNNYARCASGAAGHYDQSLWLSDNFNGGAGGDWGQRVGADYFLGAIKGSGDPHIWLHEVGHTFALDDFYDWTPPGQKEFIMLSGSAMTITEFDAWMLRDWWRHLKTRISGLPAAGSAPAAAAAPVRPAVPAAPAAGTAATAPAAPAAPAAGARPDFSALLQGLSGFLRQRLGL